MTIGMLIIFLAAGFFLIFAIILIVAGMIYWFWTQSNKSGKSQVDHFAFAVSDLERAIQFYTSCLGMRLIMKKLDPVHHEAFALLDLGGANLEILQRLDENNQPLPFECPPLQPPYCPHLALRTANLDLTLGVLRQQNLPILEGPLEIPGKVKWLYFHDPDHNVIEYVQWL